MRPTKVITLNPEDGQHLSVVGDNYRTMISGKETEGQLVVIDMFIPPKGGPEAHAHADFQESFYVIEGEIVVRSETQTYVARKGAFVSIPKGGAVHSFKNESDAIAHILCIAVKSGLEDFFEEIGIPVKEDEFLPMKKMEKEDIEKLQKIALKHHQEVFSLDYFDKNKH